MNMFKRYTALRSSKADISQLSADALIELTDDELEDATGGFPPPYYHHRRHRRRYYNRYHRRYEYYYYYD